MKLRKTVRVIAVAMAVIVGVGIGPAMMPGGVALAEVPAGAELTVGGIAVLDDGAVAEDSQLNEDGEGWAYDSDTNTLALNNYNVDQASITGSSLGDLIITVEGQCTLDNGIDVSSGSDNNITIKGTGEFSTLILSNTNWHGLYVRNADLTIGTGNDYLWFEADVSSTDNSQDVNGGVFAIKSDWSAPDLWSSFKISPNRFYEAFRFSSDTSITFQTDLRNASVISISSNV